MELLFIKWNLFQDFFSVLKKAHIELLKNISYYNLFLDNNSYQAKRKTKQAKPFHDQQNTVHCIIKHNKILIACYF